VLIEADMLYFIVSGVKRVNLVGLFVFSCRWGKGCELSGFGCIVL
jgi:hypothetical protein